MSSRASNGRSSVYRSEADGRWHGRVTMGVRPDGTPDRRHVRGATQAEVTRKVRALEEQRRQGLVTAPGSGALTLAAWLEMWLVIKADTVRPRTLDGYRTYVRQYVIPALGAHRLDGVRPEHVEALYREMRERGLAEGTVASMHRILRAALNTAVQRRRLVVNPVALVTAPRTGARSATEPLDVDECRAVFLAAEGDPLAARWEVALALGLRQGEALGIAWHAVDLDAGTLRVTQALQRLTPQHGCGSSRPDTAPGRESRVVWPCGKRQPGQCPDHTGSSGLVIGPLKSDAATRSIPLPAPLIASLKARRRVQAAAQLAAGEAWSNPDGLIFTTDTGAPIDPRQDYASWLALLTAAGVHRTRLHDARHSAASLLLAENVPGRVVMTLLGWSDARMLTRYQHVPEALARDATSRVGVALYGSRTQQ